MCASSSDADKSADSQVLARPFEHADVLLVEGSTFGKLALCHMLRQPKLANPVADLVFHEALSACKVASRTTGWNLLAIPQWVVIATRWL